MAEIGTGKVPWLGSRRFARGLLGEIDRLGRELAIEKLKTARLAEIAQKNLAI